MQSNTNVLAHITAFTVAMIWGSTFISTKVLILNGLSPVQIFTLRFIVAYLLLLLMSLYLGRHDKRKFSWIADNWKDEVIMIALGITGGSAYFYTENEALRFGTATNVSLIVCACPLFTTLLYRMMVKNVRLSKRLIVGSILAFIGMVVVVLNPPYNTKMSRAFG